MKINEAAYIARKIKPATLGIGRESSFSKISFQAVPIGLYVYLITPYFFVSEDQTGIVYSGSISIRNVIELVCSFYFTAVVTRIIFKHKTVLLRSLRDRGSILGILIGLYALSAIWSLYPALSLFRSFQAALLFVYVFDFLDSNSRNGKNVLWACGVFLNHVCIIGLIIYGLPSAFGRQNYDGIYFGFLKNNLFGGAAGLLTLVSLVNIQQNIKGSKLKLVNSLFCQFGAGTMTSCLGLLVASVWLFTSSSKLTRIYKYSVWLFIILAYVMIIGINVSFIADSIDPLLGKIFDRSPDEIAELTGRRHIWESVLEAMAGKPFGAGFATDQMILLPFYLAGLLGTVSSAHSLYLESYVALGYLGPPLVVLLFVQWWLSSSKLLPAHRNLVQAIIVYCLFCAPSISGLGGSIVNGLFQIGSLVILAPFYLSPAKLSRRS